MEEERKQAKTQPGSEEKPKQLLFSEDEISAIFEPNLVKAMFTTKDKKEKEKDQEAAKGYRNTEVPKAKESAEENKIARSRRERMLMELEEKRQEYDFKLIKRKFKEPQKDNVYMEPE